MFYKSFWSFAIFRYSTTFQIEDFLAAWINYICERPEAFNLASLGPWTWKQIHSVLLTKTHLILGSLFTSTTSDLTTEETQRNCPWSHHNLPWEIRNLVFGDWHCQYWYELHFIDFAFNITTILTSNISLPLI